MRPSTSDLVARTRRFHEAIRERVGSCLERARSEQRPELANRPGAWVAGDLTYALDEVAETALADYVDALSADRPVTLVSEGPGVVRAGAASPDRGTGVATDLAPGTPLAVLVDPVDGTRGLMLDMRSAWALTGIAPDRGAATRLSDVVVAVQTELPVTGSAVYHVLVAQRGAGATIARHDVVTGAELECRPLRVADELPLDNGVFAFARYLPVERPLVAELERRFLEAAIAAHGLSPRLLYDDQYLCSAGQLFLVATGRYRVLADLRAWLAGLHGLANFTAKPYDLATLLVYEEAGVPVLDASGALLDGPFDTETRLDVVAFGNEKLREAFEPHLRAAQRALAP